MDAARYVMSFGRQATEGAALQPQSFSSRAVSGRWRHWLRAAVCDVGARPRLQDVIRDDDAVDHGLGAGLRGPEQHRRGDPQSPADGPGVVSQEGRTHGTCGGGRRAVKATWSVRGFLLLLQNHVIRYKLYLLYTQ